MVKPLNPFMYGRIEHEQNTVLFMPDEICDWVTSQPLLFEGVRGGGKSSILKSISWEVVWKKSGQKSGIQIEGSSKVTKLYKEPSFIGVYYCVDDMDVGYWEQWYEIVSPEFAQKTFGTYIELLYLDLFLNALQNIRKISSSLFSNANAEKKIVSELLPICFPDKNFRPNLFNHSFAELRSIISDVHCGIRQIVFKGVTESDIRDTFCILGPGTIIQKFGKSIVEHCPSMSSWSFLLLLDDYNLLSDWQAKVINTAVTKTRSPMGYKISSVKGLQKTRTTLTKTRTLIEHEIVTIQVPGIQKDHKYAELAQGVCRTRIAQFYDKSIAQQFNFKKFLGSYDISESIKEKLQDSEKESAKELLDAMAVIPKYLGKPSVLTAWLLKKGVREYKPLPSDKNMAKKEGRKMSSSYLRKFNHVAAVAMCKEMHMEFPYWGWEVLLHLSQGSIRELLRMLAEIWNEARVNIEDFVNLSPIDRKVQTRAIRNASKGSYDAIDDKPLFTTSLSSLPIICDRLGSLFAKCQSFPYIVKNPEMAAIQVRQADLNDDINNVINTAVMAGAILKNIDGDKISIGLHPILAPKYGISFRQPFYYPVPVSKQHFNDLFAGDQQKADKAIKEILEKQISSNDDVLSLQMELDIT